MSRPGFPEKFSGNNCNSQRAKERIIPTSRLKIFIFDPHSLPEKGSVPKIPEVFPGNIPHRGIPGTPIPLMEYNISASLFQGLGWNDQ